MAFPASAGWKVKRLCPKGLPRLLAVVRAVVVVPVEGETFVVHDPPQFPKAVGIAANRWRGATCDATRESK